MVMWKTASFPEIVEKKICAHPDTRLPRTTDLGLHVFDNTMHK
jgi:hypothetical protein